MRIGGRSIGMPCEDHKRRPPAVELRSSQSDKPKVAPDYSSVLSPVDPWWEIHDPNPDIRALFRQFNRDYFWNTIGNVDVKWSKELILPAGAFHPRPTGCHTIELSEPLLKFRPRRDLVQTLLHEMIHAYLCVTNGNRDGDWHGVAFHEHMFRINTQTGASVTVYHAYNDEVEHYLQHSSSTSTGTSTGRLIPCRIAVGLERFDLEPPG
ncbi:DNA-dependent metalloprotease SPRTN-like [Paramacrobiotus metropolitanus]|uniref:DNA-dependent metalloprotease SPRTN-like n=1 Tax=Paramacrobiotus metropolitanus TaxID=2943436 RepID=UPI00244656C7|nr:DNA-dependent metalloprotease SPRTN-like [Paramacrobiotus metropolitanus]